MHLDNRLKKVFNSSMEVVFNDYDRFVFVRIVIGGTEPGQIIFQRIKTYSLLPLLLP